MQIFENASRINTCIGCEIPSCMYLSQSEIECNAIDNFPYDRSNEVCVTKAITWDNARGKPVVNMDLCFCCGVCISRCKKGRMFWNGDTVEVSDYSVRETDDYSTPLINESNALFDRIYDKLSRLRPIYHNTVVRNLLITLECKCSTRRIGDVYTRMDAIYSDFEGSFGAIEVEFGQDTLSASRGLLDDIAILNTRYGVDKLENEALTVCLQLPNARQGYWQVVKDIAVVEGIEINTITIGALMLLVWNNKVFCPGTIPYYADYDNKEIRSILESHIGRQINLSNGHLGILEPIK